MNLSSFFFIYILGHGKQRLDANDRKTLKGREKGAEHESTGCSFIRFDGSHPTV